MKILLFGGKDTENVDITKKVLGDLTELPQQFFRRKELVSLIVESTEIPSNKLCIWTDYTISPGFMSHIRQESPITKHIHISPPTPNIKTEDLEGYESILKSHATPLGFWLLTDVK